MPRRYKRVYRRRVKKSNRKRKGARSRIGGRVYRFKRMGQILRIRHEGANAANVWTIEDGVSCLNSTFASGAAWGTDSMPGTYYNGFGVQFRLSDTAVSTDFTSLFDRYKITGIKTTFRYQISDAGSTGAGILPIMTYATDYSDTVAPSMAELRQRQSAKQRTLIASRPFSIFWRPKPEADMDSNGLIVPAASTNSWLDTASPTIQHNGLKFFIQNLYAAAGVNSQLDIQNTFYLAFKDPK